jgi:hypothetical protein
VLFNTKEPVKTPEYSFDKDTENILLLCPAFSHCYNSPVLSADWLGGAI